MTRLCVQTELENIKTELLLQSKIKFFPTYIEIHWTNVPRYCTEILRAKWPQKSKKRYLYLFKGTETREFTALVFSSKVAILGPNSYSKFFSNLVSNSQSYSNFKFDSRLHHAAGSQILILINPRIWKQIRKKLRIWIKVQGGYFWWKKTEVETLTLLSL